MTMDRERHEAATVLLAAAHAYWKACSRENQTGAIQWLTDTDGALVIFTRGEYRETLMGNIDKLRGQKIHFFGEEMEDLSTLQEQHAAITDQIEPADRKRDRAGV